MKYVAFAPIALCMVACGGAPMSNTAAAVEPSTTAPAEEPEPTTIEEAEQQVQRAKSRLDAQPKATSTEATGATSYAPKEPEECRALQSLERATKALCRLAGPDDARCKDATQALEQSRTRVHCP
jgi:hypothetical protein